jgi:osmotically-inducible protein OsmY
MKTDKELRKDVTAELEYEPSIDATEMGVAVKDGVVTLTGSVHSYFEKWRAERAAERVEGVRAVANELEVRLPGDSKRRDTDIAAAAVNALKWNSLIPADKVKVTVEDGWITLKGRCPTAFRRKPPRARCAT